MTDARHATLTAAARRVLTWLVQTGHEAVQTAEVEALAEAFAASEPDPRPRVGVKVFKYTLPVEDAPRLKLPAGAVVLSVIDQAGAIALYALVDPDAPKHPVRVRIVGTGHPADDVAGMRFVGTVTFNDGALVFHVFVQDRRPGAGLVPIDALVRDDLF